MPRPTWLQKISKKEKTGYHARFSSSVQAPTLPLRNEPENSPQTFAGTLPSTPTALPSHVPSDQGGAAIQSGVYPPMLGHTPIDFWDEAYKSLRTDERKRELLDAYEKLFLGHNSPAGTPVAVTASERQQQMSTLAKEKIVAIPVREYTKKIAQAVLFAKDFIASAAGADPHIALAWAGVSMLLPLLLNPVEQHEALSDGIEYIFDLTCRFTIVEGIYRQHSPTWKSQSRYKHPENVIQNFETKMTQLYCQILEYQARAVCHLHRAGLTQTLRDMVKKDGWDKLLEVIKSSESACLKSAKVIDSEKLHTGFDEQSRRMKELLELLRSQDKSLEQLLHNTRKTATAAETGREEQKTWHQTEEEIKCLQALRTSDYEKHKARNRDRVDKTCQWFLKHPKFLDWEESTVSSFLWVSGDPGSGKSVLSKSLVGDELQSTNSRTTCYFFFKDDDDQQKSAVNALSALLHQLFSQNRALVKHALPDFHMDGEKLPGLFSKLWKILCAASADPQAGEIVCILDALDECEESSRFELVDAFTRFYDTLSTNSGDNRILKILVTSRPYFQIERSFSNLIDRFPSIRLAGEGEEESNTISLEVGLVIQADVAKLGAQLRLPKDAQAYLEQQLLQFTNRTYLWVTLVIEVIYQSLKVTKKTIDQVVATIPATVDKAYEAILGRSPDTTRARKLLHIIVAATRPLTVAEMNIALEIEEGCKAVEDLDLEPEDTFRATVRNLCGLFVSVIDSRIYLIHQTAKEFLVAKDIVTDVSHPSATRNISPGEWKRSLVPYESNFVLATSCITYLLFTVFESHPIQVGSDDWRERIATTKAYRDVHVFLAYSVLNWAQHLRESHKRGQNMSINSVLEICDSRSRRFEFWYSQYLYNSTDICPVQPDPLTIGSFFGLEVLVRAILEKGVDPNTIDSREVQSPHGKSTARWSPLFWAADQGHRVAVKLLLEAGAYIDHEDDDGETPLLRATWTGHDAVVKLLLEAGANVDHEDDDGETPLSLAAKADHDAVVKLLLRAGANMNIHNRFGEAPLLAAAQRGFAAVVSQLLENDVVIEMGPSTKKTPLLVAAANGHVDVVNLLLRKITVSRVCDPDMPDEILSAALAALQNAHYPVAELLLEGGLAVRPGRGDCGFALQAAVYSGAESLVRLLVEYSTNQSESGLNLHNHEYGDALQIACMQGEMGIMDYLLRLGADPNQVDEHGWSPHYCALQCEQEEVVRRLVAAGVEPPLESKSEQFPPTSWSLTQRSACLSLDQSCTTVNYAAFRGNPEDMLYPKPALVLANHPIPLHSSFYIEFHIQAREGRIAVGLCPYTTFYLMPGKNPSSLVYDCYGYLGHNEKRSAGFSTGDVIGCHISVDGDVTFTKNGQSPGIPTLESIPDKLYPCVGLSSEGDRIRVNFGQEPFKYDINSIHKSDRDYDDDNEIY